MGNVVGQDTTYTGNPASFTGVADSVVMELSVPIVPIQDLHGYSSPWVDSEHNKTPYNFRAVSDAGVSRYGNSELGSIVGGTVAWNQLAKDFVNRSQTLGITITANNTNGTIRAYGTASDTNNLYFAQNVSIINDHVYFMRGSKSASHGIKFSDPSLKDEGSGLLFKSGSTASNRQLQYFFTSGDVIDETLYPQLFDLTAMFGSTIADYLYTLESGTAGAGVAKLKSWGYFLKDYYGNDSGSLQSVNTSAHKTYKADTTLLGNYALDSSLTLRGIPKLDANNNLYYDGDTYAPNGTVTRKYGIVDLGAVGWVKGSGNLFYSSASTWSKLPKLNAYLISTRYTYNPLHTSYSTIVSGEMCVDNSAAVPIFRVRDDAYSNNTAQEFTTAMSGVYLVYELATHTTETATAYAATQSIDPDGTEEYVDYAESQGTRDVAIPVGHDTTYANICPISGSTGLNAYVSPTTNLADATTYSADWTSTAGTVYGGTIDMITGLLTVTMVNKDLGDFSWTLHDADNHIFRSSFPSGYGSKKYETTVLPNALCSKYVGRRRYDFVNNPNDNSFCIYQPGSTNYLYIKDTSYSNATAFINSLDGVQLVYELATPLTYQLTPQEVAALIGANKVWASTNTTVTVTVRAPLAGFQGWLIKAVTNGTPVEIPLKYIRAETYTVTPDQRMEWSAERDVTGVLHRETVQNLPPKIEFNTPLLTNVDINALNTIIKNAFTSYLQRNITIQFYDPERDQYWEWDCYMPDVHYSIRMVDAINNVVHYEETRYAFIGR